MFLFIKEILHRDEAYKNPTGFYGLDEIEDMTEEKP